MALASGTRLGDYEVLEPIGAGGMGEVYRARDVRLDRTVAIKVLPAHLSQNPQLRQRFEQEARAVSSLNHPNICTLHDIGQADGIDYMVLEYIDGETLADRIARGPLPVEEAIAVGVGVADALDKAHRSAIVHRDVKPGNIILTRSGPKLLDFGLAKLRPFGSDQADASALTAQKPLTEAGAILGTFQYMAPEQLEGGETDGRTDIFAFGAVLYELLTGRKAFEGKSQASLISAILSSQPRPIAELRPVIPARVDRIVRRCLAKDPEDRWQSARDVVLELSSLDDERDTPTPVAEKSRLPERILWALALVGAAGAGVLWTKPDVPVTTRLSISLPQGQRLMHGSQNVTSLAAFDISPDGRNVVYAVGDNFSSQLHLRRIGDFESVAIPGTEGAVKPTFSRDGQAVAYWAGSDLMEIRLDGGAPTRLLTSNRGSGVARAPGGTIILGGPQLLVYKDGSEDELIRVPDRGGIFLFPQMLPDGDTVLVTVAQRNRDRVLAVSLETGAMRTVLEGYSSARYVRSGHLIVLDPATGNLLGVEFDLERMETRGTPAVVVENVYASARSGIAQYAISETGTLVYAPAEQGGNTLVWVDRDGRASPAWEIEPGEYAHPRVSPDGGRVAVDYFLDGYRDIWVYELARGSRTRLTSSGRGGVGNRLPGWTPDGERVSFAAEEEGAEGIYTRLADGSEEAKQLIARGNLFPLSWSPDGAELLFQERREANWDVLTVSPSGEWTEVLSSPFGEASPSFSPDGRYIAYISDESGRWEVYVRSYPAGDEKWTISTDGGQEPLWARDGSELFYRKGQRMMVVDVSLTPTFRAGRPRVLFDADYVVDPSHPAYDVAPDGDRFLMIQDHNAERTQLNVVTNFFAELKQRTSSR